MLDRFRHIVEEMRGLIDRSALLAVSGGIDSMCLADLWLRAFGADTCSIAHCNFNLRGEDSDADEALVTGWAEKHGVRIHKVSFDTVQYASENGISIEMAARELRYRWFGKLCQEHGYKAVVVAHHADDNAETMVLNMVRGAGLKGLSGMKPVSALPYSSCGQQSDVIARSEAPHVIARSEAPHVIARSEATWQSFLLRPLLTFTRKQIEGHVFTWKVPYREDRTNASTEYRRNSIRHEVFPLFERMNPSYVRTLNREMTYFKDASEIVAQWCRDHLPHVVKEIATSHPLLAMTCENTTGTSFRHTSVEQPRHYEEGRSPDVVISTPDLLAIPQWRYLLYYILEPYGFNSSSLESLEALLTSDRTVSGKRFESEEYTLLTERDTLVVIRRETTALSFRPSEASGEIFMPIRTVGAYHVNGSRVVVETLPWSPDMPLKQPAGTLVFDADKLKFPFVCRKWRAGDWMIPLGMKGRKKLSDLFTDLKFGHCEKAAALVLVDTRGDFAEQQHVAAALPVRIDDCYKVTSQTKNIIRIIITEN